jgi:hypothetical protein
MGVRVLRDASNRLPVLSRRRSPAPLRSLSRCVVKSSSERGGSSQNRSINTPRSCGSNDLIAITPPTYSTEGEVRSGGAVFSPVLVVGGAGSEVSRLRCAGSRLAACPQLAS